MNYKFLFLLFIFLYLLNSCTIPTKEPAPGPNCTNTLAPTKTPEPTHTTTATVTVTATATATQEPITGKIFFDMNGSGFQDRATFYYSPERIEDERQPLQPDLVAVISEYLIEHPDIQKGDLITIEEPGLAGFSVCHNENCQLTDSKGNFVITNPGTKFLRIKIIDPHEDSRSMQMRYINKWNGPIDIPAYEMNGYQIPEQHLNNTTVIGISEIFAVYKEKSYEIGLMQGFLTLPYSIDDAFSYGIGTFYDLDTRIGTVRNYAGSTKMIYDPGQSVGLGGTGDTHIGIDYEGPEGLFVIDPMGGGVNGIYHNNSHLVITGEDPGSNGYVESYGHLKTVLVDVGETIYRGQITSVNGKTNTSHPHIHYGFNTNLRQHFGKDNGVDPYMDLVETRPRWEISTSLYSGEESEIMIGSQGFFTVVNMPIFP